MGVKTLRQPERCRMCAPRVVPEYRFQGSCNDINVYANPDLVAYKSKAKSSIAWVATCGGHTLKAWSSAQECVTLSSAEVDLMAATKTTADTIGNTDGRALGRGTDRSSVG